MNRVTWILLILIALGVIAGLLWFFAPKAPIPLQDPSVSRNSKIQECNGAFSAKYTVTNNLTVQQIYKLSTSRHPNFFAPNPPTVTPGNTSLKAGAEFNDINVGGLLLEPCEEGRTTLHVEAANVGSVYNDFGNTFGPVGVEGDPPERKDATPDFRYTFELVCCEEDGVFRIRDFASIHIELLWWEPKFINCSVDRNKEITVTGVLKQGENYGTVDFGLRKDGATEECHLITDVQRPQEEEGGEDAG